MSIKIKGLAITAAYDVVWLIYTVHYIVIFYLLTSDQTFGIVRVAYTPNLLLPLNIVMNSISHILAVIGLIIAYFATKRKTQYWNLWNKILHGLMLAWVLGGSIWVSLIITSRVS